MKCLKSFDGYGWMCRSQNGRRRLGNARKYSSHGFSFLLPNFFTLLLSYNTQVLISHIAWDRRNYCMDRRSSQVIILSSNSSHHAIVQWTSQGGSVFDTSILDTTNGLHGHNSFCDMYFSIGPSPLLVYRISSQMAQAPYQRMQV